LDLFIDVSFGVSRIGSKLNRYTPIGDTDSEQLTPEEEYPSTTSSTQVHARLPSDYPLGIAIFRIASACMDKLLIEPA
jgi:hypothetical protein